MSRHLGDCATCRDELGNAINVLGVLAIDPPQAAVRDAILRRAVAQPPVKQTVIPGTTLAESRSVGGAGQSLASAQRYHSRVSSGPLVPGWALVAAAAAILRSGSAGWGYENEQSNGSEVIADIPISLVDDSATAYLLDDSDLPVSATGVVFAEPQAREVYLVRMGYRSCHLINAIKSGCSRRTTSSRARVCWPSGLTATSACSWKRPRLLLIMSDWL